MPREPQNAEIEPRATPAAGAGDAGHTSGVGLEGCGGWDLVQYDWGTRQRDPVRRTSRFATRIAAICTRVMRRFARGPGTPSVVESQPTLNER
jgi:hypothetical protein